MIGSASASRRRRGLSTALLVATTTILVAVGSPVASAAPPAPEPTSSAASPAAPDPHPPLGGHSPDGAVVGGSRLLSRGTVLPAKAPKLPSGLTARAWVLSDLDTGQILAARDAHGRYQPASVLKVLASLVLLPQLPGDRVVTASFAAANSEGSAVGLVEGGTYTVDTLFKSLLLMSGNDAATALAEAAGGVARTVAAMNAEAQRLGAYDTFVQTPSGLDGWQQLTSAYDLSLVLRAAVDDPRFLAYDRTATAALPPQKVGARTWGSVPLANQSEDFLSGVSGALVAKTGYTDAAQHTYLAAAERGGRRLGVIFLRAQRAPTDQWQQAASLLNWGFALPRTTKPVGQLVSPTAAPAVSPTATAATSTSATTVPTAIPTTGESAAAGSSGAAASTSPSGPAMSAGSTGGPSVATPSLLAAAAIVGRNGPGAHGSIWGVANVALLVLLAAVIGIKLRRRTVRTRKDRRRNR